MRLGAPAIVIAAIALATAPAAGTQVPPPQPPDTTPPALRLSVLTRSLDTALLRHALLVHVESSEYVRVRLLARARGHKVAAGRTVVPEAGFRGARVRLTAFGRKLFRKARSVRVYVRGRGVDLAGNGRRARARRTLFRG